MGNIDKVIAFQLNRAMKEFVCTMEDALFRPMKESEYARFKSKFRTKKSYLNYYGFRKAMLRGMRERINGDV